MGGTAAAGDRGALIRLRGGRARRAPRRRPRRPGRDGSRRHPGAVLRAASPTKG